MNLRKFLSGLAEALAATGSILEPCRYPSLKGSDLSRLRGDVSRIGSDFYAVIGREHGPFERQLPRTQVKKCRPRRMQAV